MAEKEERILVARSTDYTLTDTDKGELFEGKIAPHCANVFTRQEAIERMAKSVYDTFSGCAHITPFEQVEDKYKQGYYKRAEAALNALLEGK